MNIKQQIQTWAKNPDVRLVVMNVVAAIVIAVTLLACLLVWLRHYTEHGVEVEVPDVTGLYLNEVDAMLTNQELRFQVIDSTFAPKVPLGTVVEQNPPAYSHAKHGRVVYLVMNASFRPKVMLPELYDISYRQAMATLRSLHINVNEDIIYEPSQYKDLVLDIRRGNESLNAGTMVEEGETLTLVVGRGMGTEKVAIPDLRGKNYKEVRAMLLEKYLTPGNFDYDEPVTDSLQDVFVVYHQMPNAGEIVTEGTRVDVKLSKNIEKAMTTDNSDGEEDFF